MPSYATYGALAGGAAGAYFGGPAGAMAGAGAGGAIGGQFDKKAKYKSPSYADINLARDNPYLYAQLMKQEEILREYEALYNQRRTGPSLTEQRMMAQSLDDVRGQMANRGMLGSSTGFLTEQDMAARFQDEVANRMFQEQQALLGARANQQANLTGMYGNAQNAIMGNLSQEAMTAYNQKMAEDAARNQFYAGLMSGGAQMYSANRQSDAATRNARALEEFRMARYGGVPTYQPQPVQQMPASNYNYQFGQSSPYYRGY